MTDYGHTDARASGARAAMREPYFSDPDLTLYQGDAFEVLREMPAASVHMACTSPPFFGLRDYGTGAWEGGDEGCAHAAAVTSRHGGWDGNNKNPDGSARTSRHAGTVMSMADECKCGARRIDSQIGLESSPDEWAARLVDVFREVRRVLRDDGTLWVECGDSYASTTAGETRTLDTVSEAVRGTDSAYARRVQKQSGMSHVRSTGAKPKDLIGQPWLLAFALRADGWYLRSCIVWAKPNAMPESVTDRPTTGHSYVFLFSKRPRYFYDAEALREPAEWARWGDQTVPKHEGTETASGWIGDRSKADLERSAKLADQRVRAATGSGGTDNSTLGFNGAKKNARTVWTIPTEPNALAICRVCDAYWQGGAPREHCSEPVVQHFAAFPRELVRRMILAGTSERGVCAECGAPWVRRTDSEHDDEGRTTNGQKERSDERRGFDVRRVKSTSTSGWLPSCECSADVTPATVLDPFSGSGTTLLVARQLGRHGIGIELNERYAAMTRARLAQLSLLAEGAA